MLASSVGLTGAIAAPIAHTYVVNDTADRVDASPGVNGCRTAADTCTLRAAIQEANAAGGTDRIVVPGGVYELEIPPINENAANVGDFEIIDPVVIDGAGQGLTDHRRRPAAPGRAARAARHGPDLRDPSRARATSRSATSRCARASRTSAAARSRTGRRASCTLEQVTVRDSYATEAGGGLNNADIRDYEWPSGDPPIPIVLAGGRVEIKDSIFTGNGSGGTGAAINNVSSGSITISDGSEIKLNPGPIMRDPLADPFEEHPGVVLVDAGGDYPIGPSAITNMGEWDEVGTIKIVDSFVVDNTAEENGGGDPERRRRDRRRRGHAPREEPDRGERRRAVRRGRHRRGSSAAPSRRTTRRTAAASTAAARRRASASAAASRSRAREITDNEAEANGGGMSSDGDGQVVVTGVDLRRQRRGRLGRRPRERGPREPRGRRLDVHAQHARSCTAAG